VYSTDWNFLKTKRRFLKQHRSFGAFGLLSSGEGEVVSGVSVSAIVPFERATVVSYRLSIVTIALSLTIRPRFAIECLRHSNQQGSHFKAKFGEEGVNQCKLHFKTIWERHG